MRKRYSFLNIVSGIFSQFILIILGLISRKIFVNIMGLELLGINGLFSNIISMLSLAELGIGGAIYYSLYKPLANNDLEQVKATMQLYGKFYKYIALAVGAIGLLFVPFINIIIKENVDNTYLIKIYLCFLLDSVLSYILVYKKNIFSADQKSYIINIIQTIFSFLISVMQIVILITTHDFILYLIAKILLGFLCNIIFYLLANKKYPYLKGKDVVKLNSKDKAEIIKNAKALFIGSIAGYCVFGTDNILISIFIGITEVGLYSNYILIITIISNLVGQVFNGVRASFGNFLIKESLDKYHELFNKIYFLNFWITCFSSVCLIALLNPFISLWIGKNAIFPFHVVIIIVVNFYLRSMTSAIETVRNSAGLYSPYPFFKYWSLLEGIINLLICVILAGLFKLGIMGILLATTISTASLIFVMPWNVYKYVFKRSLKPYCKNFFIYLLCSIFITAVILICCNLITTTDAVLVLLIRGIICLFFPNIIIVLLFHKTSEFQYILNLLVGLKKITKKENK